MVFEVGCEVRGLLLAALLVPSFAIAETRVPTIDEMVALKRVSQPAVSPDGSRVERPA